jgi:murein DD-endopeptidase MepM/ murein hydrolase activator NlpD
MNDPYQKTMDLLFPKLKVAADQWVKVNLDEAYQKRSGPVLDMTKPEDQQKLIQELSGDKLSYGGFLEDRSAIWKGFESGRHLGVDFNNLQPGEAVGSLLAGKVTHVIKDDTKQNGWGTRIIVKSESGHCLLYGHLANPRVVVGDTAYPGQILGEIAPPETNGGWFPHLHLQLIYEQQLKVPIDHVNLGYEDKENQGAGMLDPMELVSDWDQDRVKVFSSTSKEIASVIWSNMGVALIHFSDGKWDYLDVDWKGAVHRAFNLSRPGLDWTMSFGRDEESGQLVYSLARENVTVKFSPLRN